MFWQETPVANPIAIWSILSSVAGGLLLFIMARLAFYLYRSGDVDIYAKRMADLNPRCVKLFLRVENGQSKPRRLSEISLYAYQDKQLTKVAELEETPLLRLGEHDFIQGSGKESSLQCNPHSANEAVLEFRLSAPLDEAYLVITNAKGKKRKAKIYLGNASQRLLSFRRF